MGTHQSSELFADALEETKSVVFGESSEEVLDSVVLVTAGELLELSDDRGLVASGQSRGAQDAGKLSILLQGFGQADESFGSGLEGRRLRCSSILNDEQMHPVSFSDPPSLHFHNTHFSGSPSTSFIDVQLQSKSYQSGGIGAVDAEEGDWRLDRRSSWGSVRAQSHNSAGRGLLR